MLLLYTRSLEIEQRLEAALRLVRAGRFSTPQLAEALRVSIPTVSRCVTALRQRGHDIRAEKHAAGWQYVLYNPEKPRKRKHGHSSKGASGDISGTSSQ